MVRTPEEAYGDVILMMMAMADDLGALSAPVNAIRGLQDATVTCMNDFEQRFGVPWPGASTGQPSED